MRELTPVEPDSTIEPEEKLRKGIFNYLLIGVYRIGKPSQGICLILPRIRLVWLVMNSICSPASQDTLVFLN